MRWALCLLLMLLASSAEAHYTGGGCPLEPENYSSPPAPAPFAPRQPFYPSDYTGSDYARVQNAIWAAEAVNGAVVLDRIYVTGQSLTIAAPILLTGGGIQRACQVEATVQSIDGACVTVDQHSLNPGETVLFNVGPAYADTIGAATIATIVGNQLCTYGLPAGIEVGDKAVRVSDLVKVLGYTDGVELRSILLDGANRCNGGTHDWRYQSAVVFRGRNVADEVVLYDSPAESFTVCGATITNSWAWQLQGSLVHKSCATDPPPPDFVAHTYVEGSNLATDAVMQHSEGLVTHSANAGNIHLVGNVLHDGSEGVFGLASGDDVDVSAAGGCYENFPWVFDLHPSTPTGRHHVASVLYNIPEVFR